MSDTRENSDQEPDSENAERRRSYPYRWEEEDERKRADGEGRCDWDERYVPKTKHFDSEEAYQEAYDQWSRHVQRRIGIDPENWPRRMNVSDTIEMCKQVFGISRSTFYRYYRILFTFDAQTIPIGRKTAFREDVIVNILGTDEIERGITG